MKYIKENLQNETRFCFEVGKQYQHTNKAYFTCMDTTDTKLNKHQVLYRKYNTDVNEGNLFPVLVQSRDINKSNNPNLSCFAFKRDNKIEIWNMKRNICQYTQQKINFVSF